MSDREARALGAGSTIMVEGTEYTLSPIKLKQLSELQRECLRHYKQQYLMTFHDNLSLLPREKQGDFIEKKMEEVARWDVDDLPPKKAYSAENVPISDKLKKKLREIYPGKEELSDEQFKNLLVAALDSDQISSREIKELTGVAPIQGFTAYDLWWVTGCYDGMIHFAYESVRVSHPRIKKDDVARWPIDKLVQAAQIVSNLTNPAEGNT